MSEYTLIIDSTCDLTEEMYKGMGVRVIRMKYVIDSKEYTDNGSESSHEFYNRLKNGETATTVQVNVLECIQVFEEELEKGRDVLYLCFASACSGSYGNAHYAGEECKAKWPDRKIIVIDSKCLCGGEGLLAYHAARMKKSGMSIEELRDWVIDKLNTICHYFTVDDLNHLYRGGRLSRGAAVMGTLVGIKPVMYANGKGELCVGTKVRGRVQAVRMLAEKVAEQIVEPEKQLIIINHADCLEEAERLAEDVKTRVKPAEVRILDLGPTIGAHVGPGCLAIFFIGKNRNWTA